MCKARDKGEIDFDGVPFQLFPDPSWLTLQQRRTLQPLVTILRERSIPYCWGFMFSLMSHKKGKTSILRAQEDTAAFCEGLNISCPVLPSWESLPTPLRALDWWQMVQRQNSRSLTSSSASP